jgi:hypothetical protein
VAKNAKTITLADWNATRELVRELRLKRMTAQLEVKRLTDVLNAGFRDVTLPADQLSGLHTDFEKGFIRAETIAFDDFVRCHGEHGAREAGKLRLEGTDYVVQDGDVMHFRFNV